MMNDTLPTSKIVAEQIVGRQRRSVFRMMTRPAMLE
jgi:hypothetical protein